MSSHHAFVYYSSPVSVDVLPEEVRIPSTTVTHVTSDKLNLASVRELIAGSNLRPAEGSLQNFVIVARSINNEAQNALLKLLEEPPAQTVFHLVLPSANLLLPTVLSRLCEVDSIQKKPVSAVWSDFKQKTYGERLSLIQEKLNKSDWGWVDDILVGASESLSGAESNKSSKDALLLLEKYFNRNGASKKMLLENLAINIS